MPILYDQAFNGGFSEILLVNVGAPTAGGSSVLGVSTDFDEAFWLSQLDDTGGSGTKKISIVGITWTINGGGLLAVHDVNYDTDVGATLPPILVLSGGGTSFFLPNSFNDVFFNPPSSFNFSANFKPSGSNDIYILFRKKISR